jgi:hypothetical protein
VLDVPDPQAGFLAGGGELLARPVPPASSTWAGSTTDLSTRSISACTTSAGVSESPAHTSSASEIPNVPANTDSRAQSTCWAGVHRS